MTTVYVHTEVIRVTNHHHEMREFSDIFDACNWADNFSPWQYA